MQTPFEVKDIYSFPKVAGIYRFTNKVNGKVYIGESNCIRARMKGHRQSTVGENVMRVSMAFKKYGFDNFIYEVLEIWEMPFNKNDLIEKEGWWIAFHQSTNVEFGYNVLSKGNSMKGVSMSDETKKKIGKAHKGRRLSPERVEKMKEIRGEKHHLFGKKISNESRKNMSDAQRNNPLVKRKPISRIDIKSGEIIDYWRSIADACRFIANEFPKYSPVRTGIAQILDNDKKAIYGFRWKTIVNFDGIILRRYEEPFTTTFKS